MDVSILIISYNYEKFIEKCLCSCLNQFSSGLDYEVIVVDDGSTDNTSKILSAIDSHRFTCYRISNSGIEKASNFGFSKSRGKYIVRVDADDVLLPNYLICMKEYLSENYDFIYPDYKVINQNDEIIKECFLPDFDISEIICRGDFLATGTLVKSEAIRNLSGYNTSQKNNGLENYEFILRCIRSGLIGHHVPKSLFYYRRHSENISNKKRQQIIQNGKKLFKDFDLGVFRTNKFHPYNLEVE